MWINCGRLIKLRSTTVVLLIPSIKLEDRASCVFAKLPFLLTVYLKKAQKNIRSKLAFCKSSVRPAAHLKWMSCSCVRLVNNALSSCAVHSWCILGCTRPGPRLGVRTLGSEPRWRAGYGGKPRPRILCAPVESRWKTALGRRLRSWAAWKESASCTAKQTPKLGGCR